MDFIKTIYDKLRIISGYHRGEKLDKGNREDFKITIHVDLLVERLVEARKIGRTEGILSKRKPLIKAWAVNFLVWEAGNSSCWQESSLWF